MRERDAGIHAREILPVRSTTPISRDGPEACAGPSHLLGWCHRHRKGWCHWQQGVAMATASKASKAGTGTGTQYSVQALAQGNVQYRHASGGTGTVQAVAYQQATRALRYWAAGTPNAALVHALVHLGWCAGSGARSTVRSASSAAYKHGAAHLQVGAPAAPQVVAVLTALHKAGAPAAALATVYATMCGTA